MKMHSCSLLFLLLFLCCTSSSSQLIIKSVVRTAPDATHNNDRKFTVGVRRPDNARLDSPRYVIFMEYGNYNFTKDTVSYQKTNAHLLSTVVATGIYNPTPKPPLARSLQLFQPLINEPYILFNEQHIMPVNQKLMITSHIKQAVPDITPTEQVTFILTYNTYKNSTFKKIAFYYSTNTYNSFTPILTNNEKIDATNIQDGVLTKIPKVRFDTNYIYPAFKVSRDTLTFTIKKYDSLEHNIFITLQTLNTLTPGLVTKVRADLRNSLNGVLNPTSLQLKTSNVHDPNGIVMYQDKCTGATIKTPPPFIQENWNLTTEEDSIRLHVFFENTGDIPVDGSINGLLAFPFKLKNNDAKQTPIYTVNSVYLYNKKWTIGLGDISISGTNSLLFNFVAKSSFPRLLEKKTSYLMYDRYATNIGHIYLTLKLTDEIKTMFLSKFIDISGKVRFNNQIYYPLKGRIQLCSSCSCKPVAPVLAVNR